jgi:hypothetical protein
MAFAFVKAMRADGLERRRLEIGVGSRALRLLDLRTSGEDCLQRPFDPRWRSSMRW